MITVKVRLQATGVVGRNNHYAENEFTTRFNGTDEEAKKYYAIGNIFNMGIWYDGEGNEHEDDLMRVTSCVVFDKEEFKTDHRNYKDLRSRSIWNGEVVKVRFSKERLALLLLLDEELFYYWSEDDGRLERALAYLQDAYPDATLQDLLKAHEENVDMIGDIFG